MPTVLTWDKKGKFSYTGSVTEGIKIGGNVSISAEQFFQLLEHFARRWVPVGNAEDPPPNSLEVWIRKNIVDIEKIASFVAPILVQEACAKRQGNTHLSFSEPPERVEAPPEDVEIS